MKKKILIWVAVVACILISIGGIKLKVDNDARYLHDKMVDVVESKDVKGKLQSAIRKIDKNAFTEKGIILSYKIEKDSIRNSPMGGILASLEVNGDENLIMDFSISKYYENGDELVVDIDATNDKLNRLLRLE